MFNGFTLVKFLGHFANRLAEFLCAFRKYQDTDSFPLLAFTLESALGDDQERLSFLRFFEIEKVGLRSRLDGPAFIFFCHVTHPLPFFYTPSDIQRVSVLSQVTKAGS